MEMDQSIRLDEEISCEFGAASVLLVHAQQHHHLTACLGVVTRLG
jgi:hypothetical protein